MKLAELLERVAAEDFYGQFMREGRRSATTHEVSCICPFHSDTKPSLNYNTENGFFRCVVCGAKGHYLDFLMLINKLEGSDGRDQAVALFRRMFESIDLSAPKATQNKPTEAVLAPIDPAVVEKWHQDLMGNVEMLTFLASKRGLSMGTAETHRLGWDGSRITVPIWEDGVLVNVRRYKPNSSAKEAKWLPYKTGYGKETRLYPCMPEGEEVILCEGEFDTLVLLQNGFDAVTFTHGVESNLERFLEQFRGKVVHIVYDCDKAGRDGAIKHAEQLAGVASSVDMVVWPNFMSEERKEDVTDWFVAHNLGAEEFECMILNKAHTYVSTSTLPLPLDVLGILPRSGWLRYYIDFCASMTDAPPEYHLACGLSIISACVGNKIRIWGHAKYLKCNIWTILLGSSGDRKSTSIDIALDVLNEACPGILLPDQYSQESMIRAMAIPGRTSALLHHDEFSRLLRMAKQEHMAGFIPFLTEMYEKDGCYVYDTMKNGRVQIKDPALSILAASTLDWVVESIDENVIRGGFMPRCLFVPGIKHMEDDSYRKPPDQQLRKHLVERLADIGEKFGTVMLTEEVADRYQGWQKQHKNQLAEMRGQQELLAFMKRMPAYMLKFSVLFQLALDQTIQPTVESMEQAIRFVEFVKRGLAKLITKDMSYSKDERKVKKVYEIICNTMEIEHSALLRSSHLQARELGVLIDTLKQSDLVEIDNVKRGSKNVLIYRPKGAADPNRVL